MGVPSSSVSRIRNTPGTWTWPARFTPYELASFCGLEAAADLLREAQSRAAPHPTGMPEIWIAAASRLPEAVLKLDGGVNCMWRGATPLMMAAGHAAHFRVADLLLELGAEANVRTSTLHASCEWHFERLIPALHKAAFLGYSAAARILLRLGADPAIPRARRRSISPAGFASHPLSRPLAVEKGIQCREEREAT